MPSISHRYTDSESLHVDMYRQEPATESPQNDTNLRSYFGTSYLPSARRAGKVSNILQTVLWRVTHCLVHISYLCRMATTRLVKVLPQFTQVRLLTPRARTTPVPH